MPDPVAFQVGRVTIRWYGIFVALGFLAAYQLAQRRSRHLGLGEQAAPDLTFAAMVGGILGARLLYVITYWRQDFSGHVLDAFKVWQGGLVFYGGFIGAAILVVAWSLRKRFPLPLVGDMAAPALALGHAFGRVGCFLNGCCFGYPSTGFTSITYPGITADGMINGPLYVQRQLGVIDPGATVCHAVVPIQLVSVAGNAVLCALLLWCSTKPAWRGKLFALYLVVYAVMRFAIEFGRGDYLSRTWGLTSAQILCLLLFPLGVAWLAAYRKLPSVLRLDTSSSGETA